MRVGAFQVVEPLPVLREPHAIAMLRPWVDAGSVGALALLDIEQQFGARQLASLARPGTFYDLTRYRPTAYIRGGKRGLSVPNTVVTVVTPPDAPDLVIIKMLEPHMFAETYVESVLSLLHTLGIRRYVWVGSMYDMVPHTRPLLVSGGAIGAASEEEARRLNILKTDYQGPSTLTFQVVQRAPEIGIEAMWCIVHLPQYVHVDEDYAGKLRLMRVLQGLYNVAIDNADVERALEQVETMDGYVAQNPELATILAQFEARYESRRHSGEWETPLPPDVVRFLNELGDHPDGAG